MERIILIFTENVLKGPAISLEVMRSGFDGIDTYLDNRLNGLVLFLSGFSMQRG